jgi:hypothetical protein
MIVLFARAHDLLALTLVRQGMQRMGGCCQAGSERNLSRDARTPAHFRRPQPQVSSRAKKAVFRANFAHDVNHVECGRHLA